MCASAFVAISARSGNTHYEHKSSFTQQHCIKHSLRIMSCLLWISFSFHLGCLALNNCQCSPSFCSVSHLCLLPLHFSYHYLYHHPSCQVMHHHHLFHCLYPLNLNPWGDLWPCQPHGSLIPHAHGDRQPVDAACSVHTGPPAHVAASLYCLLEGKRPIRIIISQNAGHPLISSG